MNQGGAGGAGFGGIFPVPPHWDPSPYNVTRHTLTADTDEYKFAEGKFHETLPKNQIVQIERIQNRRKEMMIINNVELPFSCRLVSSI